MRPFGLFIMAFGPIIFSASNSPFAFIFSSIKKKDGGKFLMITLTSTLKKKESKSVLLTAFMPKNMCETVLLWRWNCFAQISAVSIPRLQGSLLITPHKGCVVDILLARSYIAASHDMLMEITMIVPVNGPSSHTLYEWRCLLTSICQPSWYVWIECKFYNRGSFAKSHTAYGHLLDFCICWEVSHTTTSPTWEIWLVYVPHRCKIRK